MEFVSRRVNEGVMIGDDIHVTVLEIHDDRVKLGITSPNDFPPYWEQTVYLEGAGRARELQAL